MQPSSPLDRLIRFCLVNKLVVALVVAATLLWGVMVAPFDWNLDFLPRSPVPVDAIPDIGENQQIVFTRWMGRSPQDIEDQVSYPLTVSLLGIPGVKTVRSYSVFGFSSIYVIFDESVDFYWSRSRILEKLASLSSGTLPEGVQPALGPDATALGQVYMYTLEGRDPEGNPAPGWSQEELRSIQDWTVRYALMSAEGISEVASVGGYVQEYQIDVDPDAMRSYGVTLNEVHAAVRSSNVDVGARTIEVNRVEYVIRGIGFLKSIEDLENSVVAVRDNVPVFVRNIANVSRGPALRRGVLDVGGAEAVGGVAVVRYGGNPLAAIESLKEKIREITPGLPSKELADGTISKVTIVPFYDRSGLIHETLETLRTALTEEILVTVLVVLFSVWHLRSAFLISALLPLAVLMCFIAMRQFGIDANIVALSGIAIAIGTMVDMGIILCENILSKLQEAPPEEDPLEVIYQASTEVGGAVLTAVSTTIVSFLPVFTMEAAEGKLFRPLAFTKTFALIASVVVALAIIPAAAHILFSGGRRDPRKTYSGMMGYLPSWISDTGSLILNLSAAAWFAVVLARHWAPMGAEQGESANLLFVVVVMGSILGSFRLFQALYPSLLRFFLDHKALFLVAPTSLVLFGASVWLGFETVASPALAIAERVGVPTEELRNSRTWSEVTKSLPGLSKEFMPPLDEGSYLYMPTTMTHASIGEVQEVMALLDKAVGSIPEVRQAVGKLGRVDSALDPAPISMIETVINYKPEFRVDEQGHRILFAWDPDAKDFRRDDKGDLIPDPDGQPFRNWRPHIRKPDDIWSEILSAAKIPGLTSAPRLQPIAARIVMLQSGMRAPMGIKVRGPDLATIEAFALELERLLKEVPSVQAAAVFADRIIGKPYLEIEIDRQAIARYGIPVRRVQDVIEVAIGGKPLTTTVEGRERYPVRVRYLRELRDDPEALGRILVPGIGGVQIPLDQLTEIRYVRGPQVIKSEDSSLLGYVLFDKQAGRGEVDVVEDCQRFLTEKIEAGELEIPKGVSYTFAGSYENQIRSEKKLMVVLPVALFLIFLILYLQFGSEITTLLVFTGIFVAWGGGFLMVWLYNQPWFLDFQVHGTNLRTLFQIHPVNLSVAIWVGFIALFGIASDDGVVIATYLEQSFETARPATVEAIRSATAEAGTRRIRPCLMTTATTILALLPVLTSSGRGSDIMIPMAIPSFGGMMVELLTLFVVPVLYCGVKEIQLSLFGPPDSPTSPPSFPHQISNPRKSPNRRRRTRRRPYRNARRRKSP